MKNALSLIFFFLFSATSVIAQQDSLQIPKPLLPLQITRFDAKAISKNVQLQWTVSSNEEAKNFEIERAENGRDYQKVGSKLSSGRSGEVAYEFVDALPKKNAGLTYRIKIISKDGSALYSEKQSTRIEDAALQCKLKQNPVRNAIEVEIISRDAGNVYASVYTAYGQKVLTETARLSTGTNRLTLSSQNLLPGLHRLVVENDSERKVLSFVKE